MSKDPNKIESVISEKRVKLHLFEPSNRKIWTVVGKGKEHWLDPDLEFCSCPSYYFNSSDGKKGCYHLESLMLAQKQNKVELIKFSDEEFGDFISGLISDL
ncbi:MAG: hypothetical protein V3V83_00065 [Nitrosopumilaceae archaeon]|nr:hypothetical protein [Nitrososphaerota archaeon]HEU04844.1 hypothetical protein [Nitrosopumilus sp.]